MRRRFKSRSEQMLWEKQAFQASLAMSSLRDARQGIRVLRHDLWEEMDKQLLAMLRRIAAEFPDDKFIRPEERTHELAKGE